MLQIKINEKGYVEEFMLPGSEGILSNGIKIEEFDIDLEDFRQNFRAYKFFEDKLTCDTDTKASVIKENENNELRNRRERECFKFINRGWLWYNSLSSSQLVELTKWYKDWLDVTKTKKVPEKPSWID